MSQLIFIFYIKKHTWLWLLAQVVSLIVYILQDRTNCDGERQRDILEIKHIFLIISKEQELNSNYFYSENSEYKRLKDGAGGREVCYY